MSLALYEDSRASFDKRFFSSHYAYRDFYSTTTGADPTATTASYTFGTATRVSNIQNWPMSGDARLSNEVPAQITFAQNVMVQCTEDAYIIFSSANPRYLRLYTKYLLAQLSSAHAIARLADEGISATITEISTFIPANALMTFYPTRALAITFYQSTASGTIRIWAEGNQEGLE